MQSTMNIPSIQILELICLHKIRYRNIIDICITHTMMGAEYWTETYIVIAKIHVLLCPSLQWK